MATPPNAIEVSPPSSSLPPSLPSTAYVGVEGAAIAAPTVFSNGSLPPSPPPSDGREELVRNAVNFLRHPTVSDASAEAKRRFLLQKGLNDAEVGEAFRRYAAPPLAAYTSGAVPLMASTSMQSTFSPPGLRSNSWFVPIAASFGIAGAVSLIMAAFSRIRMLGHEPPQSFGSVRQRRVEAGKEEEEGEPQHAAAVSGECEKRLQKSGGESLAMSDNETTLLREEVALLKDRMQRRENELLDAVRQQKEELRELAALVRGLQVVATKGVVGNVEGGGGGGTNLRPWSPTASSSSSSSSSSGQIEYRQAPFRSLTEVDRSEDAGVAASPSNSVELEKVSTGVETFVKKIRDEAIEAKRPPSKPLGTLLLLLKKILENPKDERLRRVNTSSPRFAERFGVAGGQAYALLEFLGFELHGSCYVLPMSVNIRIVETAFSLLDRSPYLTEQEAMTSPAPAATPTTVADSASNTQHASQSNAVHSRSNPETAANKLPPWFSKATESAFDRSPQTRNNVHSTLKEEVESSPQGPENSPQDTTSSSSSSSKLRHDERIE